jgi:cytochrome c2
MNARPIAVSLSGRSPTLLGLALLALVGLGCGSGGPPIAPSPHAVESEIATLSPLSQASGVAAPDWTAAEATISGDAARGERLVARFECVRCHEGTGQPTPFIDRQCVGCHQKVMSGDLPFSKARLDGWRAQLRHYVTTPNLAQAGQTLRPSWIAGFLREPTKVRPHMEEWMPRLAISDADARDITVYLTKAAPQFEAQVPFGDAERGKTLAAEKGCFACHEFTGATRASGAATIPALGEKALGQVIVRAPDLRFARDRFRPDVMARWIEDPGSVKAGALMPTLGLSKEDARDLAAYVMTAKLEAPPEPAAAFERLPVLDRVVTFQEVSDRVLSKSCIHCHSEPDGKGSDPGPGSAGGFGFPARGIQLSSHAGAQRGYLGKDGSLHSLFRKQPPLDRLGGSRLVASLVARHEETSGRPSGDVRGMPLGLPALSPEDIQLVETWVAQGAR